MILRCVYFVEIEFFSILLSETGTVQEMTWNISLNTLNNCNLDFFLLHELNR